MNLSKNNRRAVRRKWLSIGALALVLGIVIAIGNQGLGLNGQDTGLLAGFAADVATATSTATVTSTATPTQTLTPTVTFTPTPGIGSSWIRPADQMVMMFVPAGVFRMGSERGYDDEKPVHDVYLDSYWMDKTEVTNKMYSLCEKAGVCQPPQKTEAYGRPDYHGNSQYDDFPVIYVDWYMAKAYCEWAGARLPSEAEWEKAARGTDGRTLPWGEGGINCDKVNSYGCVGSTSAVDRRPAGQSPYGLYDMAANVWEWVMDWYDSEYYLVSPASNPQGPASGEFRVLRSGSWRSLDNLYRTSGRYWSYPTSSSDTIGFRCALSQ